MNQHNSTFPSQPQYCAFDENPNRNTNTPFLPHLQQQRHDNTQFTSHGYSSHDQSTAGRALSSNQGIQPDGYEGSMAWLSGDNNMTQDESLSHSHTQNFSQAPKTANAECALSRDVGSEYGAASPTAEDRQYHHTTLAQPSPVFNKLLSTVTKVGKFQSKRVGRLSISQTRHSREEDIVIVKESAKAGQKAKDDKDEFDKTETARGMATMLKNIVGDMGVGRAHLHCEG